MLIRSGLINHIKATLDHIKKWNPTPLVYPYALKEGDGHLVDLYKFEANPEFILGHWVGHSAIFASVSISLLYQCIFEDVTLLQRSIHGLILVFCSVFSLFAYIQHLHAQQFAVFVNSLFHFEKLYLGRADEKICWTDVKYMEMVNFGAHLLHISFKLIPALWTVIGTLFPFSPLRAIPALILNGFSRIRFFGVFWDFAIAEAGQRILSFAYTFLVGAFGIAQGFQIVLITFLISQYALCLTVIALNR